MIRHLLGLLIFLSSQQFAYCQLNLDADGPGSTYELITSKLAPGYNPIEVPDCSHSSFGNHIDELFDADLNTNVFRFFLHVSPDDDRCINMDRQRNEIKTYNQSPDSLLGVEGEMVEYKWKFKLDSDFQSSSKFTHIHQLKAVGGPEASMPLITLTTRKGSPDELELRYAEVLTATTLHEVDLAPFLGEWCEATETVTYGDPGSYSIEIKDVSDNTVLFSYSNNDIRMWKTDADFVRPKWGIYRSLQYSDDLRDEEVLFANFVIEEFTIALPVEFLSFKGTSINNTISLNWEVANEVNNRGFEIERSKEGIFWDRLDFVEAKPSPSSIENYTYVDNSPLPESNFYRLKQIDYDGNIKYSNIVVIEFTLNKVEIQLYPNPTSGIINILGINDSIAYEVFSVNSREVAKGSIINNQINLSSLPSGVYFVQFQYQNQITKKRIVLK